MTKNSNSTASRKEKEKISPVREFDPSRIKIVAGLGNPGATYRATYHNVGFAALDRILKENAERWKEAKNFFYIKSGNFVFLKPNVFMNDSGEALKEALRYFKSKPENMLLIHDDSDLEIGKYKIEFGRGAAGHKGIASAINRLKTKDFWRARIGVRSGRGKAGDFILKNMNREDEKILSSTFEDVGRILFPNG
ncbi:MAG: aminoacyl-tRNA hydrolase [Minisyncoccia bacterium]|jgi:PTH1 family peptidyl-tRNA hydrolase